MDLALMFVQELLLSAVAAVGFAMLFNVPPKALAYCALGGALGRGLRFWLLFSGMPIEWATLLAATAVSAVGVYWARRLRAHPKVFTVAAIIPMIPGKFAFAAALALFEIKANGYHPELFAVFVDNVLKAGSITAALAFGLAMPGLLYYRSRPVV